VFGDYLGWVLARARDGVSVVRGRVARVGLTPERERWVVEVTEREGSSRVRCGALALTGQGAPRKIAHDAEAAPRVLDCESGRMQIARVPDEQSSDIAIVGGGESALSCMDFVRSRRPDARLTIYTANLPMSRVESFLENRVFSRPDEIDWPSLSVSARRDFIARSDRGVFGADRVAPFGYDPRCRFVAGRVTHVSSGSDRRKVSVAYTSPVGAMRSDHDYVINCTGYDPLEQLRLLLTPDARAEVERQVGPLWQGAIDADATPIGRSLELEGLRPRVHIPGLAALSQGPGFSTLGALGLLGDRVLEPFVRAEAQRSRPEPLALGA
jgi:mycobactin lysine-N-oxygenase